MILGEIKEYTLLSVFNIDGKTEDYAIYTDYSVNSDKSMNVYSGILFSNGEVKPIMDENDKMIVNNYIEKMLKVE